MPFGELAQVIDNPRSVGAEIVRPVGVDEDAGLVVFVIGIAPEVIALLDNETRLSLLRGKALGNGQGRGLETKRRRD